MYGAKTTEIIDLLVNTLFSLPCKGFISMIRQYDNTEQNVLLQLKIA
jgi:hypothetical protein